MDSRATGYHAAGPEWRPLLGDALAERAGEAIRRVATEIASAAGRASLREGFSGSLASGDAGHALLYAYLARAAGGDDRGTAGIALLERAIQAIEAERPGLDLFGGVAGTAWTTAHLIEEGFLEAGEEDPNEALDKVLNDLLEPSPWSGSYDLISGLVGFGVYAIERRSRPAAQACIERVVDRLGELAERGESGVTWHTRPELLPPHQRKDHPRGYFNLGVAHGAPGVIAFLARAFAAGIARARVRPLLDGAVAWLFSQRLSEGEGASFPCFASPGVEPKAARSAWCYGDPGIAAALLLAARCASEPAWEREAVAIGLRAAARPPDRAGVKDAGLCHGAAGLAHIFNRMSQATGDSRFAEAARAWLERALALERPAEGIGCFPAWHSPFDLSGPADWFADTGFLTGASGVALALLAAITPLEPAWDRVLLLSDPLLHERGRGLAGERA